MEHLGGPPGLQMFLQILNQAHGKLSHQRLDGAYAGWALARRRHGQSFHERIVHLKRTRLEMEKSHENVVSSKKQMACKLLRGTLSAREEVTGTVQVRRCAGILIALQLVRRVMFPKMREIEDGTSRTIHEPNQPIEHFHAYAQLNRGRV